MIDVPAVHTDTPACESRLHVNNAGAALMPDTVYDAVVAHLTLERDIGGYEAPAELAARLARQAINISTSTAASARLDLGARGLASLARASVHYYNTHEEIDRFCAAARDG